MPKYAVYLTNPHDQQLAGPHSYTSGRYGFVVSADTMDAAITATVARSREEGIYGYDWSAKIVPVDARGHCSREVFADAIIYLADEYPHRDFGPRRAISGGGIRLW